jgi:hypothetical protein
LIPRLADPKDLYALIGQRVRVDVAVRQEVTA